ncbi:MULTISPECIES: WecB/TagA/CpsF family glycosyltransferase [Bacillaceae]|uniref:N-acetylglucosaminyldiphosphoundecaprenol N-acetyl-beta-D-mannosaminyltransferase n=1 Tax=Caldibacillus thermoamylovorans TaxID=35841 RepID=A0ABD4A761_9BACI|nr:WecB/TagA/CpsF family glycosyltransferase [Caldibacillus thermoamylovorans]KIO64069.1 N-acetylmannosaminyltransferase [Caldibacillus thermoamylovorans]KIO72736.1 N-acetylmannosaminyltransferase [Caldibacillus thermoamylovorans]
MNKVKIMSILFDNYHMSEFVGILKERLLNQKKTFVVTANPELVMYANKNSNYFNTLSKANYITADGIGIVMASKLLKHPIKERVAGFDLMGELLHVAEKEKLKVYLLGAKESTLEKAIKRIKETYPNINIVGFHHGYIDISDKKIAKDIMLLAPDLIFVALGFPKQEFWIEKYISEFSKGLFMGVGGSFDVWAGEVKRAPQVWINLNLEWLYRLLRQPTRFKRMLVLPRFLIKIMLGKS